MQVKMLKLVTGENVIAEFENKAGDYVLTNPLQVAMVPSRSTGQPSFALLPYLFNDDKSVTISSSHVLFMFDPMDEFLAQYNDIFGNIVTPPKSIII